MMYHRLYDDSSGFFMKGHMGVATAPSYDHIWRNARIASMTEGQPGLGVIERGAIATQDGRIVWIGQDADLPASNALTTDCEGRWITPGLIDCHTHLVYAGNRAHEFEMRLEGASYEEIARSGGGIVSSVRHLRAASQDDLLRQTLSRLDALIAEGVTTVEVKSGYGLDPENERKSLRVARQLPDERPVTVRTTFLGAHATPPEANGDNVAYIETVVNEMLPAILEEGLADAVDAFCEGVAFSRDEVSSVFEAARRAGLAVKLHADQLSDLGGGALAAQYGALSADHLEYTSEESVRAMAEAGTVAVLLPGAFYFLRETHHPPVELFRRFGVPIAIATDSNPGTSPLTSMLLTMNMAATLFGLTVEECLVGSTRVAAGALGLLDETGTLEIGKWADFAIWDIDEPAELVYRIGFNSLHARIWRGTPT
jgi:imidazolonepropionase